MNDKLDLEQQFPGEPRLGINFDQLVSAGGRQVRRRRNAAVIGTASLAVVIVVGTSLLVPRLRDAVGFAGIPGCETVLGPTKSKQNQTSSTAIGGQPAVSTSAQAAADAQAAAMAQAEAAAASEESANATSREAAAAAARDAVSAQTSAQDEGSGSTATEAASDAEPTQQTTSPNLSLDPAQAPDGLTAIVWAQLSAIGATARPDSQLGLPAFYVTGDLRDPNELGWQSTFDSILDSALGSGDFSVYVGYDGQSAPPCHEGELDRRVTYPDGTIVDLTSGSYLNYSTDISGTTVMTTNQSVHAVGYHPDGTKVIAMSSDSLGFAGEMGSASGATPVSLDFVQQMAADPNLRRSEPAAAEVTATSSKATVPNVIGLSQERANLVLNESTFQVSETPAQQEVSDPALVGSVVSQSPAGGEVVDAYSEVQLTIGVAPVPDSPTVSTPPETVVPSETKSAENTAAKDGVAESAASEITPAGNTTAEITAAVDTTG